MGISQHIHGTDNARCLIALAMVTGQVGRPGTGLHPLRGQNNVQGASDAGLIPMVYPDYQSVANPEIREKFEALWQTALDDKPGLTVVEIMDAVHRDEIKGMYIMGENPAMSDPDVAACARGAGPSRTSRRAGHLPDRDREIRRCRVAGLGLAGEGRHRLQHQPPGADGPRRAAAARQCAAGSDGSIQEIARRMGLDWHYTGPARRLRRDEAGDAVARQHHLGAARCAKSSVTYPCDAAGQAGQRDRLRRRLPDRIGPRQAGAGGDHPAGRGARRRIPDGADHRPPARALAYRRDDPPRQRARRDRARGGGEPRALRIAPARRRRRRPGAGHHPARRTSN